MKVKTSDLTGPALDWAVTKCEGLPIIISQTGRPRNNNAVPYLFSSDWAQGGPIIEREINVLEKRDGYWYSWRAKRNDGYVTTSFDTIQNSREAWAHGPTPLIAAMRCYVASKLGETVDIPEELLK